MNNFSNPIEEKTQKKKISYDEILKKMNLSVIEGKLEFVKKSVHFSPSEEEEQQQQYIEKEYPNEYEYLKDTTEPNLTKKEYLKRKVIDHLQYRKEILRLAHLKSPRMMFSSGPVAADYSYANQVNAINNTLFLLKR